MTIETKILNDIQERIIEYLFIAILLKTRNVSIFQVSFNQFNANDI
jgi:hypothetical protein